MFIRLMISFEDARIISSYTGTYIYELEISRASRVSRINFYQFNTYIVVFRRTYLVPTSTSCIFNYYFILICFLIFSLDHVTLSA